MLKLHIEASVLLKAIPTDGQDYSHHSKYRANNHSSHAKNRKSPTVTQNQTSQFSVLYVFPQIANLRNDMKPRTTG